MITIKEQPTEQVRFEIPGPPVAKGRPRFRAAGGKVRTYTPEKTAEYENLVKLSYMEQVNIKLTGQIAATIYAYFPIPKSESRKRHKLMADGEITHTKRPDADNIAKTVLDALNGIAFDDDSQIWRLIVYKRYSEEPRVNVVLYGERADDDSI